MRSITDFLGEAAKEFGDELEGRSVSGGFDGPPLAQNRQYRARVARAEWRQATTSGRWSYSVTYEVTEDPKDEFVGRKFSEYYSIEAGTPEAGKRAFSRFIGDSGVNVKELEYPKTGDVETDNNAFIKCFEGVSFVIATRVWGDDESNTGIRYLNRDRDQALLDHIEPHKPKGATKNSLVPEINVNKSKGPFDADESQEVQQAPASLPGSGTRPPVNLPPGLRG